MSTVVSPTGTRTPVSGYAAPDVEPRAATAGPAAAGRRIASIDIVRGAVMVLMAIDHVRVFSGVPAGGPTPGVFFTRWVTHFCAPAFIFLAGTAAFLYGEKVRDRGALARFLLTRGAWLVLLELTVLRFGWTFNFDYAHYALAGVIWVIGWCMILMAALVYLPLVAVGTIGVAIIALHNITDAFAFQLGQAASESSASWFWQLLYFGGSISLGRGEDGPQLAVLYSIIPWIGVMAAGYAFGRVMQLDARAGGDACVGERVLALQAWGTAIVRCIPCVAARGSQPLYGDPPAAAAVQAAAERQRRAAHTGAPPVPRHRQVSGVAPVPAHDARADDLLIPLLERARGPVARVLTVFGRVPFFYYVLHIPLIHLIFVGLSLARFGSVIPWMTANHPMFMPPAPEGYMYSLTALYAVTILTVALLYFPCRWFAELKSRRSDRWLSYL